MPKILRRLREHGIKLNPQKCKLFRRGANYLKFILSGEGYKPDRASDEVIDKLKESPETVG